MSERWIDLHLTAWSSLTSHLSTESRSNVSTVFLAWVSGPARESFLVSRLGPASGSSPRSVVQPGKEATTDILQFPEIFACVHSRTQVATQMQVAKFNCQVHCHLNWDNYYFIFLQRTSDTHFPNLPAKLNYHQADECEKRKNILK